MIKNLLNADEEPPPGTKVVVEETVVDPPTEPQNTELPQTERPPAENPETRPGFEIPEDAKFFTKSSETLNESAASAEDQEFFTNAFAEPLGGEPENIEPTGTVAENLPPDEDPESEAALIAALESLEPEDREFLEKESETAPFAETAADPPIKPTDAEKQTENAYENAYGTIFQSEYTPPTTGETIRQSGLAWSAGIVLFGAVVFMMIFGWFADLLLGSSPWGIVGGVILGAIIGFIQLFRITSQIFRK